MYKLGNIIFIYFCVILLCSVIPYDPQYEYQINLPADGSVKNLYVFQNPVEPERLLVPPRRNVPEQYRELFAAVSESVGIPIGVLESIADVESNFRPWAKSPMRKDGHQDLGMFQFSTKYLDWYSEKYNSGILFDPMDINVAIVVAASHLKFLYEFYDHWPTVCLAYNAGMGAVNRDRIPDSSFNYLAKIYRSDLCER